VANTASYGNTPEEAPSVWTDNGLDSAVGVAGVFLRPSLAAYHSADASRNGVISAKELSYLTELFVSSYYHEDPTAFSGYAPGAGAITTYHTSDPNHTGSIQLSGLTRAIFIANNKEGGTAITGSYKIDSSVTGGFNRGPTTPDGIALETFQQTSDRRTINRESVWCQVSVSNTQGAFKIRSLAIEAQPGNRVNSTHS
jgi:hypothetical protein